MKMKCYPIVRRSKTAYDRSRRAHYSANFTGTFQSGLFLAADLHRRSVGKPALLSCHEFCADRVDPARFADEVIAGIAPACKFLTLDLLLEPFIIGARKIN